MQNDCMLFWNEEPNVAKKLYWYRVGMLHVFQSTVHSEWVLSGSLTVLVCAQYTHFPRNSLREFHSPEVPGKWKNVSYIYDQKGQHYSNFYAWLWL